jgi:UDP-N-acetylglucosamine 2-epimerase
MNAIRGYGDENLLLNHFFKIIQTKSIYLEEDNNAVASIVAIVGTEDELIKLTNIIKHYINNGEFQLCILYCGYDHLFEFCKSKDSFENIQQEMKTLEYKFLEIITSSFSSSSSFDEDANVEKKDESNFELITAAYYLSKISNSSKETCVAEKIFSVKPSKQRELILRMMVPEQIIKNVVGHISFTHDEEDQGNKKTRKQKGDATIVDAAKSILFFKTTTEEKKEKEEKKEEKKDDADYFVQDFITCLILD